LRNLRLSVTDRCNLRCAYCMPEEDYAWLPREDLLRFEEIGRLAEVFTGLGVERVRLTGGEPLLRRDLPELVRILAANPRIADLAMTTNGVLLAPAARPLREAGLHRLTVSLDTLRPERFRELTRANDLDRVLAGLDAAAEAGFASLKIDTVVFRGANDDELPQLLEAGKAWGAEVRFIEYMDVGGATGWKPERVVSRREILATLAQRYGPATVLTEPAATSAPAERFRLPDGTVFGIIASTTAPFCRACDRSRLTADGLWYLCLYAAKGIDLRSPLRAGASGQALDGLVRDAWTVREDRGAEERLEIAHRAALLPRDALKRDTHLEMHTRGG
jgi:cyclic pyranopterin phosphate synthase